jgi:hypothetical protein
MITTHDYRKVPAVKMNERWAKRSDVRRRCFDIQIVCENEVKEFYCTRVATTLLFDYRESAEVSPVYDKWFEHYRFRLWE